VGNTNIIAWEQVAVNYFLKIAGFLETNNWFGWPPAFPLFQGQIIATLQAILNAMPYQIEMVIILNVVQVVRIDSQDRAQTKSCRPIII
jgi:hypothetical protein